MRDGWREIVLSEVLELDIETVEVAPEAEYPLAGVYSFGRGLFEREMLLGSKTKYARLNRLHSGQLVVSKLKAWEGALAVVPSAFDGFVVSPEFPTFTLRGDLDPRFLALLCTRPHLWRLLRSQSRGMGGRRERVHPKQFLEVRLALPPLIEQQRIVDLIGAVDNCSMAAARQQTSTANLIASFRETGLEELAAGKVDLGRVLVGIEAGRSPVAHDRLPMPGERAVLKVSAVRFGQFDPTEVKTVDGRILLPDASQVRAGDVLMTRANTRDLVGAVCIVNSVPDDYFLSDKTLRLVPNLERIAPEFLVEVLQSETARSQIELSATGTSASMKNISQVSIRSIQIPLPTMEDQVALGAILAESRKLAEALQKEVRALSEARTTLLNSLLSRQHAIPASYDKLLGIAG